MSYVVVGEVLSPLRGLIIVHFPHGLRRGLHSFAASRLDSQAALCAKTILLPNWETPSVLRRYWV
jgi:hypothetical protein